jgi:sec-independent protein translocase protein TatC
MIVAFTFKQVLFDTILLAPSKPEFITNRTMCHLGYYLHDKGISNNPESLCINKANQFQLISIKMAGQITTHIIVALVAGLILAFPFVIREFWAFFRPALHTNEAKTCQGSGSFFYLAFFYRSSLWIFFTCTAFDSFPYFLPCQS